MDTQPGVASDEKHRRRLARVQRLGRRLHLEGKRRENLIEPHEALLHRTVVPADKDAQGDQATRHHHRHPGSVGEFLVEVDDKNAGTEDEADDVDGDALEPSLVMADPAPKPEAAHGRLTQRESEEDVDGIQRHQGGDVAARVDEGAHAGHAHEDDAVLHGEPVRQLRKPVWEPAVDGHVGHDARAVDEARLRGDEEEEGLGEERQPEEAAAHSDTAHREVAREAVGEDGVHGAALFGRHVEKEVADGDAARR